MKHDSVTCTHKKDGYKDGATATNCMGGENFWPRKYKVKPSQQEHASYKGKSAPNRWGPGLDGNEDSGQIRKAEFYKIKPTLSTNYYSILSEPAPPPCQVKAQETSSPRKRINNITKRNPLHNQIKQGVLSTAPFHPPLLTVVQHPT
jgi:hypothetical protein